MSVPLVRQSIYPYILYTFSASFLLKFFFHQNIASTMPSVGKMLAPVMHELVARSNSSLPQGKTQAEYDSQGRYNYTPSKAAAIAFCILYIIIVAYNLFQYFYHRSWFWWSMVLAVISTSSLFLPPSSARRQATNLPHPQWNLSATLLASCLSTKLPTKVPSSFKPSFFLLHPP